jgi:hypothetical protein
MSSESRTLVDLAVECFSHKRRVPNSLFDSLLNDFYFSNEEVEIISLQTIAMSLGSTISSHSFWRLLEMSLSSSIESVRANACCIMADYEKWHFSKLNTAELNKLKNYKIKLLDDDSEIVKKNASVKFGSLKNL